MTIVTDPDFEVDGPDEDPTIVVDKKKKDEPDPSEPVDLEESEAESGAEPEAEAEPEVEAESDAELKELEDSEQLDDADEAIADADHEVEVQEFDELEDIEDTDDTDDTGGDVLAQDLGEVEPATLAESEASDLADEPMAAAPAEEPMAAREEDRRTVAVAMPTTSTSGRPPVWSTRQMAAVIQKVLAVFVVLGLVGYAAGALRGSSNVARTEFVYTLDESVPDSFLREDRRLLTQVVTFKSDAVLTPVAAEFDLTVDQLRAKIDVETLNLSEVLRLDVSDADPGRAVALSRAVLDRYLQVITDATPAGDSQELAERRVEVTEQLAAADESRLALLTTRQQDAALEIKQASIQRQIDLKNDQLNRIQGSIDDALIQVLTAQRLADLNEQFELAQADLTDLEAELTTVSTERAALATATTAEPALLREVERLEAKLTTIDDELAERELAPLVASPIRELSEPLILFQSRHIVGLQGMAIGVLVAFPVAAFIAYRARKRQLWFD